MKRHFFLIFHSPFNLFFPGIKPARGLTKQKATSTLQKVSEVTTRVTRQSLEKKEHELMEQDEVN